jgi:N-acetylglucosamine kinase-like BadF-type ATPase
MSYVLSVDGGNTKTLALIADLHGRILAAGRSGCGDIYNAVPDPEAGYATTEEMAIANIESAIRDALQAAGIESSELVAGVFNMAGADWPEDIALLRSAMQARGFGHTIVVQNDALGVLHAGSADYTGVSLVCGTAVATGARGPDGRVWHSSFWQDETQGGYHLGQKTLNAVYLSELGIEPPTSLTARVLRFFGLASVEAVLHLFTGRGQHPQVSLGQLTPLLLDEAEAGDEVALRVVREHGRSLGNYVHAAARHVGIEQTAFTLVLAGGVFRHASNVLPEAIISRAREFSPALQPTRCRFEPIIGVLLTALEVAGVPIDDALLKRLEPTIPDATLFATLVDAPNM